MKNDFINVIKERSYELDNRLRVAYNNKKVKKKKTRCKVQE